MKSVVIFCKVRKGVDDTGVGVEIITCECEGIEKRGHPECRAHTDWSLAIDPGLCTRLGIGCYGGSSCAGEGRFAGPCRDRRSYSWAMLFPPAWARTLLASRLFLAGSPARSGRPRSTRFAARVSKPSCWPPRPSEQGDGKLFVAGGVENMSQAPHLVDGRMDQLRYGNAGLRDALLVDGLWCPFEGLGHGRRR